MNQMTTTQATPLAAFAAENSSGLMMLGDASQGRRELATIQMQAMMAVKAPRIYEECKAALLEECKQPALAAEAVYEVPRGGIIISDPSIRLAEAAIRVWKNANTSVTVLAESATGAQGEARAWDIERNVMHREEFWVPYTIDKKNKDGVAVPVPIESDRDKWMAFNARASRVLRECIKQVIPRELFDAAIAECDKTLAQYGPIEKHLQETLNRFSALEVSQKYLEAYLGKPFQDRRGELGIKRREIIRLESLATALENGDAQPEGVFKNWKPKPSTAANNLGRQAVYKNEVWPKEITLPDGEKGWEGRGGVLFDKSRHKAYPDGKPAVAPDGTLALKDGVKEGVQRSDSFVLAREMIKKADNLRALEAARDYLKKIPIDFARRDEVLALFNAQLARVVRATATTWPVPATLADGRQVLFQEGGSFTDNPAPQAPHKDAPPPKRRSKGPSVADAKRAKAKAGRASGERAEAKGKPDIYTGPEGRQIHDMIVAWDGQDGDRRDVIEDLLRTYPETFEDKPVLLELFAKHQGGDS